jgi:nucleotide-binding universal stress UspA family protein
MMITKILIGIDDSKYAEHATAYGFEMAEKFGAEVGLVHIVEPVAMPPATTTDTMMGLTIDGPANVELMNQQEILSDNIIDRTSKKYEGRAQITHFTEYGSTADGIINCSKEFKADLIVIGTHSRSGFDRLLMGSVAEHVVRHADVPVLVVPFTGQDS